MKLLIVIIFIQYSTTTNYANSGKDAETLTSVIIKDINSAFNIVTNNTVLLKSLIPEMYNFNVSNTKMVFKLPKVDGSSGKMVFMHRTDFIDPKFPNLTTTYMELMKERRNILKSVPHNLNDSTVKMVTDTEHSNSEGQNEWTELGLEGWTGEVSRPSEYFHPKEMQHLNKVESNQTITGQRDLKQILSRIGNYGGQNNKKMEFYSNGIGQKIAVLNGIDEQDGNVYIARVNDPFGFSTKWEFKNNTILENIDLTDHDDRLKRNILTLYSMIKCSTGCEPLLYKGYGCYCGFLGAGVPVDGVDRCCKLHDKCYENSNCISYLEYFVPYIWKCYRGKPLCALDHGEFGGPQSCAARLCYCDMRLSRCLKKFACPRRRAICRTSTARQFQNLLLF